VGPQKQISKCSENWRTGRARSKRIEYPLTISPCGMELTHEENYIANSEEGTECRGNNQL